ncbi:hypothetical protein [Trinickia dinghuensis]|uniref:DUF1828 domain-containing protein n=1 Tax=Trinickia dinghuensis TaxID=2291023 RepID=A0A3D8JRF3_9BURK|nr:hypothetical protein [Trinickia dinghuensis]RDU95703.1 hypothetical protein DWV00_27730 [Trinickia dinghuensis]
MERLATNLKRAICGLFEVHDDEAGVQRVVTPLEYPGSGDRVVVRVRSRDDGYSIDDNGEAALYAGMAGGDVDSESVARWVEDLARYSPARFDSADEAIKAYTNDVRLTAPYVFRVAEAAQQLFAIATSRTERQAWDFKQRLAEVMIRTAKDLGVNLQSEVELPIAGGLVADHVIDHRTPLIVVAATNATRLLEAEIIHMQYRLANMSGFVLAIAESQTTVGKRQFERANYYTGTTVTFSEPDLPKLVENQLRYQLQ